MTCTDCGRTYPRLHTLLDGDGAHPRCLPCLIQLAMWVERYGNRLVVSVERVTVPA